MERLKHPLTAQEILDGITDEMAQEEGYPNAEALRLAYQLGNIAGEWRRTKKTNLVQAYHNIFYTLIKLGWKPENLDLEDALPAELMPKLPQGKSQKSIYKTDLVERVAKKTSISKAEATRNVNAFIEVITEALAKGDTVVLTGFGTFKVHEADASLKTRRKTQATKHPVFSAGVELKKSLTQN